MSEPRRTAPLNEPCCMCGAAETGEAVQTPIGICEACACSKCRGFKRIDDRGFMVINQPFFEAKVCTACGGKGTRAAETTPPGCRCPFGVLLGDCPAHGYLVPDA